MDMNGKTHDEKPVSDTPAKTKQTQKADESSFKVKCGNKTALFFPSKLKKNGKGLSKCIKYNEKWLSPSEFESFAGLSARKWKQSIKCEGVALGEWLLEHAQVGQTLSQQSESVATPSQQQENAITCSLQSGADCECSQQQWNTSPCGQHQGSDSVCNPGLVQGLPSEGVDLSCADRSLASQCNWGIQGERIKDMLTKFGIQVEQVGNEVEAMFPLVLTMGEKILKQASELCALRQELNEIKMLLKNGGNLRFTVPSEIHNTKEHTIRSSSLSGVPQFGKKSMAVDFQAEEEGASCAHGTPQVCIKELQSKVDLLASRQVQLEQEREKESRKCNVLLGNIPEVVSETFAAVEGKVEDVFRDHLNIACSPNRVRRLGKKQEGKNRLILVKLQTKEDKVKVLRAARALKDTGIFLMEDLSKAERERRRRLVAEMKIARREGKKAYIRYSDGELIINGQLSSSSASADSDSSFCNNK